MRSAIGFVQWLSNHWPFGLEWPAGVDRPEPEPGSPSRAFFAPPSRVNGVAAWFEAMPERLESLVPGCEEQAGHRLGNQTLAAAMRLGRAGRIASPGALCRALGVNRSVYYAVVRRYRDEVGAGCWPRAGNDSERMLIALSTSGDTRFASRRARPAA